MTQTTADAFLGGRLTLLQPRMGYRAGVDPVLLAAATEAHPEERVLELGTGVGVALFCLASRVGPLTLTGVEREPTLANLARRNAESTGIDMRLVEADLAALPFELRQETFDHVLANPPFFDRTRGTPGVGTREAGRGVETPLATWVDVAIRRLAPGGRLTMIWPAPRWPDLLRCLDDRLGGLRLKPLHPRAGRAATLMLVSGCKGSRAEARLCPPLILHEGAQHTGDREDYSAELRGILRGGAPLDWG